MNVHFKIGALYCLLAGVLVMSVWLVYDNTRTLIDVNRRSQELMHRRDMADSLVYSLLEAGNAERSLCLGLKGEWNTFDRALDRATTVAEHIRRTAAAEPRQAARADSLIALMAQKRIDMVRIMNALGNAPTDKYYRDKVRDLKTGRDSVVIHPDVHKEATEHETVYEVVKTRKTFLARLADAFRGQRTDTVKTTRRSGRSRTDSAAHSIDIADSVAGVLSEIKREEDRARELRQQRVEDNNRRLQLLSLETAMRTEQLLKDISREERASLEQSIEDNQHERRMLIVKVSGLAFLAVFSALVLMLFVVRDIRRAAQYSRNLERAKAETERIMQQRERLLLTITHDIKAPAASIAGFIELLTDCVHDERARSYVSNIGASARHLLHLVSALLDYHRLENGKAEPQPVSFEPRRLVESCADGVRPQAAQKGLTMRCEFNGAADTMCRADAFRIKQVIDNLLTNAVKYTAQGGITLSATLNGTTLVLKVSDTGSGMTPDETKRVFNAFTRLPSAQGTEGVGLGLSIVREVVNMLGGDVRIASTVGKGSTFTVVLPVERIGDNLNKTNRINKPDTPTGEPTADNQSRISPITPIGPIGFDDKTNRSNKTNTPQGEPSTEQAQSGNNHSSFIFNPSSPISNPSSIILLDDDRLQLQLLKEMFSRLKGAEWHITACRSAKEALRLADELKPEVMMIDQEMPEMNGTEVMHRLPDCGIKAVAMTAHERSIEPKLRAEGFADCLFKPFTVAQLAELMSRLTGRKITPGDIDSRETLQKKNDVSQPEDNKENSNEKQAEDPFAALTAFADGDKEAERQILNDFRTSLNEALTAFRAAIHADEADSTTPPDRTLINRTAHRLLPTMSMTGSAAIPALRLLNSEGIKNLSDSGLVAMTQGVIRQIKETLTLMNNIGEND